MTQRYTDTYSHCSFNVLYCYCVFEFVLPPPLWPLVALVPCLKSVCYCYCYCYCVAGILQSYVVQKEWYGKCFVKNTQTYTNVTCIHTVKNKNFKMDLPGVWSGILFDSTKLQTSIITY